MKHVFELGITNTNTNSFVDNQIALTSNINQHKISYNDWQ